MFDKWEIMVKTNVVFIGLNMLTPNIMISWGLQVLEFFFVNNIYILVGNEFGTIRRVMFCPKSYADKTTLNIQQSTIATT